MTPTLYSVLRPDGSVIPSRPGIDMTDALWNARALDERLHRLVQPNRTNVVSGAKRAGYSFIEIRVESAGVGTARTEPTP